MHMQRKTPLTLHCAYRFHASGCRSGLLWMCFGLTSS